jgi:Protein of unknown function (DUF1064)
MSGWAGWRDADVSSLGAQPVGRPAGNKYHARKTTVDGQQFDSAHEAAIWQELRVEQASGAITELVRQRRFPLVVAGRRDGLPVLVGHYTADFVYRRAGTLEILDAKSRATKTEAYQLRKRLFEACYGLSIRER